MLYAFLYIVLIVALGVAAGWPYAAWAKRQEKRQP
jgi:hypothetical protein